MAPRKITTRTSKDNILEDGGESSSTHHSRPTFPPHMKEFQRMIAQQVVIQVQKGIEDIKQQMMNSAPSAGLPSLKEPHRGSLGEQEAHSRQSAKERLSYKADDPRRVNLHDSIKHRQAKESVQTSRSPLEQEPSTRPPHIPVKSKTSVFDDEVMQEAMRIVQERHKGKEKVIETSHDLKETTYDLIQPMEDNLASWTFPKLKE